MALLSFFLATCSGDTSTQPKPVATQLAFVVSPTSSSAGSAFSPAVQVAALDAGGGNVPDFADSIRVTIETNPGSGTLSGAAAKVATGGVATFADLSINRPGVGYRLRATANGL
ncbi:MAG TPA: hypothetical protein VFI79_13340, partial [Gemmatimonadales bacterium]|nr:hypothetical protein [Gemmatimonadales bacterium]